MKLRWPVLCWIALWVAVVTLAIQCYLIRLDLRALRRDMRPANTTYDGGSDGGPEAVDEGAGVR